MIRSVVCPSCLNRSFDPLISFGVVPHSGFLLSEPEQSYRTIQLSFEFCSKCTLIRRNTFEGGSHDYTHVSRTTGHRLPHYAVQIAESFRERGIGIDELIVEVGANDGAFLVVLAQLGFANRLGLEPSFVCAAACRSKGHLVENVHLDQAEALRIRERYGSARAVVCRHTLEHVADPFGFLLAMRALLRDDGILFLEVPDARVITHHLRGHELWDEHLHGFSPENLQLLVQRAGFWVDNVLVKFQRSARNVLLWCSPASRKVKHPRSFSVFTSYFRFCRSFAARWASLCEGLLAELPNWPRPIACIGASHPQSNFLLFTGLGHHVSLLVDDDLAKIGHHVPIPQPVPVISASQLLDGEPPGTVIRGAFGYEDWMDQLLAPLVATGVRTVTPYDPKFIGSL